jgi:hypothetical protein
LTICHWKLYDPGAAGAKTVNVTVSNPLGAMLALLGSTILLPPHVVLLGGFCEPILTPAASVQAAEPVFLQTILMLNGWFAMAVAGTF